MDRKEKINHLKMKNKSVNKLILVSFAVIMIFSGCGRRKIYEKFEKFSNYSWNRFKYLNFDIDIKDTADTYDIFLSVRHITQYPYKNLDVNFTSFSPSGEERSMDYSFRVKDDENKFLGEGMGDLWDIELPIRKAYRFSEKGIYKFEIENKMTKYETPGIVEVGIVVRKSK